MMTEEEFNKRQGGDKFALGSFYSAYPYFPGQNTYEEYVATTQRRVDALSFIDHRGAEILGHRPAGYEIRAFGFPQPNRRVPIILHGRGVVWCFAGRLADRQ